MDLEADPWYQLAPGRENWKTFAKRPHILSGIRGPLAVEGGTTAADRSLRPAVLLPGEGNGPLFADRPAAARVAAGRRAQRLRRLEPGRPRTAADRHGDHRARHERGAARLLRPARHRRDHALRRADLVPGRHQLRRHRPRPGDRPVRPDRAPTRPSRCSTSCSARATTPCTSRAPCCPGPTRRQTARRASWPCTADSRRCTAAATGCCPPASSAATRSPSPAAPARTPRWSSTATRRRTDSGTAATRASSRCGRSARSPSRTRSATATRGSSSRSATRSRMPATTSSTRAASSPGRRRATCRPSASPPTAARAMTPSSAAQRSGLPRRRLGRRPHLGRPWQRPDLRRQRRQRRRHHPHPHHPVAQRQRVREPRRAGRRRRRPARRRRRIDRGDGDDVRRHRLRRLRHRHPGHRGGDARRLRPDTNPDPAVDNGVYGYHRPIAAREDPDRGPRARDPHHPCRGRRRTTSSPATAAATGIFGGNGDDRIDGNGESDVVFGDNGRMLYIAGAQSVTILWLVESIDEKQGGVDTITTGMPATTSSPVARRATRSTRGDGQNIVFGDHGRVTGSQDPSAVTTARCPERRTVDGLRTTTTRCASSTSSRATSRRPAPR